MSNILSTDHSREYVYERGVWKGEYIALPDGYFKMGERLLKVMKDNANSIGQIDAVTGQKDTYGNMIVRSIRCALWLRKQKITAGDVVSICTPNHLNTYIPLIAAALNASIFNPWWFTDDKNTFAYFLTEFNPKVVFIHKKCVEILKSVMDINEMKKKIVVFGEVEDFQSFNAILSEQSMNEVDNFKCIDINSPEDPALILSTSGCTGYPKGIVLPYRCIATSLPFIPYEKIKNAVGFHYSTINWVVGINCTITSILNGATIIVMDSGRLNDSFKFQLIEKYKVAWILVTPVSSIRWSKDPTIKNYDFSSVKYVHYGGSKAPKDTKLYLQKIFPNSVVVQGYGNTETTTCVISTKSYNHLESIGVVCVNSQAKIVSFDDGKLLGFNENGEICTKNSGMMLGYYKNETATKKAIDSEGFFHTGDMGYYNENGEFFFVDRENDLIKDGIKMMHISSSAIEDIIIQHPDIIEVAVVPKHDEYGSEYPMAFIVKKSNAMASNKNIIAWINKNLPDHLKLSGDAEFMESLPRGPTGKISKTTLRQYADKGLKNM